MINYFDLFGLQQTYLYLNGGAERPHNFQVSFQDPKYEAYQKLIPAFFPGPRAKH